jgi:hypothetical protein
MMDVEWDLEENRCKKIENKSFGQRRMDVCRDESRGHTYRSVVLKKRRKKMLAWDYINVK